jgi:hypothetical protein
MTRYDRAARRAACSSFRGVGTSQRLTLSSTISACNLPSSAVMRPTVMSRFIRADLKEAKALLDGLAA